MKKLGKLNVEFIYEKVKWPRSTPEELIGIEKVRRMAKVFDKKAVRSFLSSLGESPRSDQGR